MMNRALAVAFFCLAPAVLGCGQRHTSIVGKWVTPLGASGSTGMVYEFRSDSTMSQYSYVDMRKQMPSSNVMYSPKFSGTYTFQSGYLVYSLTSVKAEDGTASMPQLKAFPHRYRAVLDNDTLTLMQSTGQHDGSPEVYQRQ